jgi:hypothetical protein
MYSPFTTSKTLLGHFLLNPWMGLLHYSAHTRHTHTQTHTHTQDYTKSQDYAESQWMDWPLSDYLVHWLLNNSNQLYAHTTLCMHRCVTRRHFSLNALFHTITQVLTNMHALMSCKTNISNECFITYFTAIRALTSMYTCMPYQTTHHGMPY